MTSLISFAVLLWGLFSLQAQNAQPFQPVGKLIDIGGYRVHLNCTGAGQPTVMVVGGGFSFDWALVETEVEKFARICTYDPSGTAWSDPGPGASCPQRVNEIHSLFGAARLEGPYVLVGLSTGALVARLYAAEHPNEVAGMVIVDHAFMPDNAPRQGDTPVSAPGLDSPPVLVERTPIVLTVEDDPAFSKLPDRIRRMHRWADSIHPALPTAKIAEQCARQAKGGEKGLHPLGAVPLVIVSTGNDSPGYSKLQNELLALSENSSQLVAEKSFHSVEISEPEVVARAIRQVVQAVRKEKR
jgi:pimeloyl-ACP methyl ester carboxylesterase